MGSITKHAKLVSIAVAIILVGTLLGAGVASGQTEFVEKSDGYDIYTEQHTMDCGIYECDYKQMVSGTASNGYERFEIHSVLYYDGEADDEIRYTMHEIWEEHGEHFRGSDHWFCASVDGLSRDLDVDWDWNGHSAPNYGTAVVINTVHAYIPCLVFDTPSGQSMALYKNP